MLKVRSARVVYVGGIPVLGTSVSPRRNRGLELGVGPPGGWGCWVWGLGSSVWWGVYDQCQYALHEYQFERCLG